MPVGGYPIGIPGDSRNIPFIYHIEMAEFQMFTGISIDTSDLATRRLFLQNDGTPADPSVSAGGLGQLQDVIFRNSTDFIPGINSGNAGNFSPTGTINPYTPGPALGA
jgi:hypothetical protein